MDTGKLIEIGGSEWQKNGMHRIYFNNVAELAGLKCKYYNSGNISSATWRGDEISNSEAKRIEGKYCMTAVYYDVISGTWGSRGMEKMQKSLEFVINAITEAAK